MAGPYGWRLPASGGTTTGQYDTRNLIGYVNGVGIAVKSDALGVTDVTYVADSPETDWTQTSTIDFPATYKIQSWYSDAMYAGGTYSAMVQIDSDTYGTAYTGYIYTTDPVGTAAWLWHEMGNGNAGNYPLAAIHDGTNYVVAGASSSGGTTSPLVGYSASLTGAYTYGTTVAETGYATSTTIIGLGHYGGTYVTVGDPSVGGDQIRASTSILSGWGTATVGGTATVFGQPVSSDGTWAVYGQNAATSYNSYWYATSPSGTWSVVDVTATTDPDRNFSGIYRLGSYWARTYSNTDAGGVLEVSASALPTGGFQRVRIPGLLTDGDPGSRFSVAQVLTNAGRYLLSAYGFGQIFYATGLRRSYLRQRQSPVRAPSRVGFPSRLGGVDLRQRQTPLINR